MATHISLDQIIDNPFQSRQTYDRATIRSLADEMKAEGVWSTVLQGRRTKNGKVQLVFGHRRLRALRLLNVKTVPIEIVDLTDAQMALRSLEENLQREGLGDFEKADAINRAIEIAEAEREKNGQPKRGALQEIADRLGLQQQWVSELRAVSTSILVEERAPIQASKLAAVTASLGKKWGGKPYVKTLVKQAKAALDNPKLSKPTTRTVELMRAIVNEAPEPIRERVKAAIIDGDVTTPAEAETKARRLAGEHTKREKPLPADLNTAIVGWTRHYRDWAEQLKKELIPYLAYIEHVPANLVERFQAAQLAFMETAQQAMFVEPKPAAPRTVKGQVVRPKGLNA